MTTTSHVSLAAFLVLAVFVTSTDAMAQSYTDATAKARGYSNAGPAHARAARRMRHASDYAAGVHAYTETTKKVEPKVAKQEVDELGRNLKAAQQDFSEIRKQAGTDKAAKPHLDAIDKHLATALAEFQKLHAACEAGDLDKDSAHACCSGAYEALQKAIAEHEAMLKPSQRKE